MILSEATYWKLQALLSRLKVLESTAEAQLQQGRRTVLEAFAAEGIDASKPLTCDDATLSIAVSGEP